MNARSYCRLTRPVLTGLIVVFYTFFGWRILCSLQLPVPVSWFLALAVVAPWLCGGLLAGGLHEFMHQSFFGVLPGARRSLRRWHGGVLAGMAAALAALSWWLVPEMPVGSTVGFGAAILALPLLNRRAPQSVGRLLVVWGSVLLGCMSLYFVGGRLYAACLAAPWAVLPGGLLIAGGCFRIGFDRRQVRARAGRPFRSELNSVRGLFRKDGRALMATIIAEQQRRDKRVGRDWLETSVNCSDRAWLRVLLHEQYGPRRQPAVWVSFAAGMLIVTAMPLGIGLLLGKLYDPTTDMASLCEAIATFGRTGFSSGHSSVIHSLGLLYLTPAWMGFVMALIPRPMPRVAYPLSRRRLAWLDFLLSWRLPGIGVALQVCGFLAIVIFAGLLAGIPFRVENMRAQTALLLMQLPILSLIKSAALARRRVLGLTGFGLLFILFFGVAAGSAPRLAVFVSWPAAAVSLAATALGAWIYWRLLLRRYSTSDLNQPIGMIQVPTAP